MKLFQVLNALDPDLQARDCKIHLAVAHGAEDPLDVYLAGNFDDWQTYQTRKNFERPQVVSLIALPQPAHWLFAGVHDASGCATRPDGRFRYALARRPTTEELDGRLIVRFERPGRQSYLLAERWQDALLVAELRPQKLRVSEFPGYSHAMLTKAHLDIVVKHGIESWRSALRSVAGVYLIADRSTGKLYVGSATAGEGIWARWSSYAQTGHGGNKELKALLVAKGSGHAECFQFGVLEIADSHASADDVLAREAYWKRLLLTREFGNNSN
jgi:GIY-YIG catalytic domain